MTQPQRPAFYEGQILAAADLTSIVDHARDRAARHDRYLHYWGVAEGLTLAGEAHTDADTGVGYVTVTLAAGVAVDGTGREVVVPAAVALSEARFQEDVGSDPGTGELYPVFLSGLDQEPVSTSIVADTCGTTGQPDRTDEAYQITFGRPGDERLIAGGTAPEISAGPGDGSDPWLILVGFVAWQFSHFTAVAGSARGVAVHRAGVRADTVAARAGTLALRAAPEAAQGGAVLTVDDDAGLVFGRYRADGSVDPLLTVSAAGDLTVRGNLAAEQSTVVPAVSGVASDGMILPLPAGIDAEQVAAGSTVLHVRVAPRAAGQQPTAGRPWLPGPVECTVDSSRRVRCRIRWLDVTDAGPQLYDLPGAVDFLVLASVAADAGTSGGSGT